MSADLAPSEDLDPRVPRPCGFYMLLALPEVKEQTDGGIYIPEARQTDEMAATCTARVLLKGPDCYEDKERFNYPWCNEGDWVLIRSYGGHRIMVNGQEFRLIPDDGIMATVGDPSAVSRVMGA